MPQYYAPSSTASLRPGQYVSGAGLLDPLMVKGYTGNVAAAVNKYGDQTILSAAVVRTPLQPALDWILNKGTGGDYNRIKKRENYNSFFHLAVYLTTAQGRYILEKNATIHFGEAGPRSSQAEVMDVHGLSGTIHQLLENTKAHMGNKFIPYNAGNNNCQSFIAAVLTSNGAGTPELLNFVQQETAGIFQTSPFFRKLANSVTDVGAVAQPHIERETAFIQPIWKRKWFGKGFVSKDELKARIAQAGGAPRGSRLSKMNKPEMHALLERLGESADRA